MLRTTHTVHWALNNFMLHTLSGAPKVQFSAHTQHRLYITIQSSKYSAVYRALWNHCNWAENCILGTLDFTLSGAPRVTKAHLSVAKQARASAWRMMITSTMITSTTMRTSTMIIWWWSVAFCQQEQGVWVFGNLYLQCINDDNET